MPQPPPTSMQSPRSGPVVSSLIVCVCRARVCACMRDLDRISPGEHRRSGSGRRTRSNLIRSLSKSKLNPEPAIGQLVQGTLSRQSSSRLRRESTGFSAGLFFAYGISLCLALFSGPLGG